MNEIDSVYRELAARLRMEGSRYMPQILQKLVSLEQARIVRELPAPSAEIAKRLNLGEEIVDVHLRELFEKGLIFPTKKGYQMARTFSQLHDAQTNPRFDESLGVEYFELWQKLTFEEQGGPIDILVEELAGGELPALRVVPRWKSIRDITGVSPFEDVREILKAQEILALIHCVCQRLHPHRECDVPNEKCIVVGRTAQYHLNRGDGKKLSLEEALDLVNELDKYPVVHLTLNQKSVNLLLCNCHSCCCNAISPMMEQNKYRLTQGIAKSRFQAAVDLEKCRGCKTCLDRCHFKAAQMKHYPEFGEERAYIDPEKCMGCGSCVVSCPVGVRTMKLVRPAQHIPDTTAGIYG
jgi:electron transport complex protein RnfB